MERNPQIELAEKYINSTRVSLFLTGKAGTGKTTFLRHIVETTRKRTIVVAPTGVAAENARGVTIHSFFQFPLEPFLPDVKDLVTEYQMPDQKRQLRKEKLNIIRTLDLLIIDEISMVRADLLDAIDDSLRRYRHNPRPFGGVQLLMIGDIQQLPPVVRDNEKPYMDQVYPSPFFFHSKALKKLSYITIELQTIYRQQDKLFVDLLNNIRDNHFDAATLQVLNARYNPYRKEDLSQSPAIRLTTHNRQAESINQAHLDALAKPEKIFNASISGNFPEANASTASHLVLKEGARVMFVKNDSSGRKRYFNGSMGTITGWGTDDEGATYINVRLDSGDIIAVGREVWENIRYEIDPTDKQIKPKVDGTFTQYPLKLGWAVTIHKAQGLTFDKVEIDAANAFSYGQVYVALSRCRTLQGLTLSSPISAAAAFDNSEILSFTSSFTPVQEAEQALHDSTEQYFYDILFELIDLSDLQRNIERLRKIYYESLRSLYPAQTDSITDICNRQFIDLVNVAERFKGQINAIRMSQGDRAHLLDRVSKGVAYFSKQLWDINDSLTPLLSVDIDNQEVMKRHNDYTSSYRESYDVKMACLKAVEKSGFSVDTYLQAKTNQQLADLTPPARKKKAGVSSAPFAIYAGNNNPELVAMLVQWRKELSKENNTPAYTILHQKTLLAIANELPKTHSALQEIKGMGKMKMKAFGDDILEIIGQYCESHNIPFVHLPRQDSIFDL